MPLPITFGAASALGFGLFSLSTAGAVDAYFPYVSLLLPGNGTNGAQNNTFLDSSTNNFTITRNGNTTQGTFSPYGDNWSNYFDGSGDYLQLSYNSNFSFGSGDFTIEGWWYLNNLSSAANPITFAAASPASANDIGFFIYIDGSSNEASVCSGGTYYSVTGWSVQLNSWQHFAFVRQSGTLRLYINGVQVGSASANVSINDNATWTLKLGAYRATSPTRFLNGYLSNIRLLKGTCQYLNGTTFTPPTSPLTAISGTSLLTCQSNRFIDNSSNNFTITRNGDVSVQRFSPFSPTASYSAATIGGSGYFDGSGDYLNGPTTGQFAPTGDFTISMWFYPTSFAASYYVLAGSWNAGASDEWLIQYDNTGAIRFLTTTDSTFSAAGVVKLNQWQFLSISRSGSTVTGYINGTSFRSYTLTGTVGSATKTVYVGIQAGTTWPYVGYISDYRLVAGSAQSATPPTSPATAISGTNTLLNFTNAGIIDNAMMNDLETVGSAQISTAQSKFGGGSVLFNGTTSKCVGRTSPNLNMGSGDFTVECWVYWNGGSTPYQNFVGSNSASFAGNATFFRVWGTSASGGLANKVGIGNPTHDATSSVYSVNSLSTGTWTHVAATRSSGIIRVFINGNLERTGSSDTSTYDFGDNGICVGQSPWDGANGWYNGYIDDLRITKGYARYTASFTPPTQAFPTR